MEKEYRLSLFNKFFYGLMAIGLAIFAVFLVTVQKPDKPVALQLFPLALLIGAVLILVNIVRKRVVIGETSILYVSLFTTRQLDFTAIKGCRIEGKRMLLEPLSPHTPSISIGNYQDLRRSDELAAWAKGHFPDLNAQDLAVHQQGAANDARLGATEADRQKYLQRSKDIAIAYTVWGIIMGVALLFVKGWVSNVLLMAWPILGIVLMVSTRGTIKFVSSSAVSPYPFIMLGVVIPCMMSLGKACSQYSLFRYGPIGLLGLAIAGVLFVLLYVSGRNTTLKSRWSQISIMGITALVYGIGSVILMNCSFDPRPPVVYPAAVLGRKMEHHSRSDSYSLKLSPWNPMTDDQNVDVDRGFYDAINIGDSVNVNLKPGLLHIPWYYITAHLPPSPAATQP